MLDFRGAVFYFSGFAFQILRILAGGYLGGVCMGGGSVVCVWRGGSFVRPSFPPTHLPPGPLDSRPQVPSPQPCDLRPRPRWCPCAATHMSGGSASSRPPSRASSAPTSSCAPPKPSRGLDQLFFVLQVCLRLCPSKTNALLLPNMRWCSMVSSSQHPLHGRCPRRHTARFGGPRSLAFFLKSAPRGEGSKGW